MGVSESGGWPTVAPPTCVSLLKRAILTTSLSVCASRLYSMKLSSLRLRFPTRPDALYLRWSSKACTSSLVSGGTQTLAIPRRVLVVGEDHARRPSMLSNSASPLKILSSVEPSALRAIVSNKGKDSSHWNGKGLSWSTSGSRALSVFTASSSAVASALCTSARMGPVTGSTSWRTVFATSDWETRLHGSKWNLPSSPKPKAHSNVANDEGSCTREKSSASATLTSSSDALQICFRSTSTGNVETTSSRLPPSQGPFAGFTFWTSARSSGDKRDKYSADFSSRSESSRLALTTSPSRLPVA
mmetsp:Transcript_59592/g.143095  ORF Transcript_59592/g.143095 Transcript_59592/m.143095 type:complete len:301 (-) Transcript_59592:1111-2013(-)